MKKDKVNISKCNIKIPKINDYRLLDENEYIIKDIEPDCNCFYRSLSYYFRDKEDNYNEFRQLICTYIENHIEDYYDFVFVGNHLHLDTSIWRKFSYSKKTRIFNWIFKKSKKNYEWAVYFEMSSASILFNCAIRLYAQGHGEFEFYNEFSNDIISSDFRHYEIIKLFFVNNNHFNLLFNKEIKYIKRVPDIQKEMDISAFSKIIIMTIIKKISMKNSIIKDAKYYKYV